MSEKNISVNSSSHLSLGFVAWLGGAVWVANQLGYGFWDGVVWLFYVGRYIAAHFTQLTQVAS
jgi:hypothetical protein